MRTKSTLAIALAFSTIYGQAAGKKEIEKPMTVASGTFEVKMLPPSGPAASDGFVRFSLDKTFQGPLEGSSRVEMMATNDGSSPSGGYVALEKFEGKLDGKTGGFVMQHSGIMSPGSMEIRVVISPGSGRGELAGIAGTLEIRRESKRHFYTLRYALPERLPH